MHQMSYCNWSFVFFYDLQLSRLQLHQPVSPVSVFDTESKETNQLKIELERAKKEKNITSGLVTQMQKDMSNKVCLYLLYITDSVMVFIELLYVIYMYIIR